MNKRTIFLLGLSVYPLLLSVTNASQLTNINCEIETKSELTINVDTLNLLIYAIINVESNGNDSAIGDTHLGTQYAVGALQIRPIMVKEVNRILKLKKSNKRYQLNDRYNRRKSIEMFLIWKRFHHKNSDLQTIARSWNGGPKGMQTPKTYGYWKKVENELKLIN
jgi:soluble lytic murein transglycosylase-like protein